MIHEHNIKEVKFKYQLRASRFLDWYITDAEDLEIFGRRALDRMKNNNGYADISVVELWNDQSEIPSNFVENPPEEDIEIIFSHEIEFINDLKNN